MGINSTIFAYGQTGTGKTHTMDGYAYSMGEKGPKPIIEVDYIVIIIEPK